VRAVAIALGPLAIGACAQIPSSGAPAGAGSSQVAQQPGGNPEVRVFAEGPHPGDSVYSIVAGFLEASGTVADGLRTAREYLTAGAAARWRPDNGVSVYDHTQERISARAADQLEFTAPATGSVDDQGVFLATPPGRAVVGDFGLVKVDGNWRIGSLPDGLFVSRQDFDREYTELDLHFLAAGKQSPVMVPDPIHLRREPGLPTALVNALLRGPSRWLAGAVTTAVPPGAALEGPVDVQSGVAVVHLNPEALPVSGIDRDDLVGQLVLTLTEDPAIIAVEIAAGGRPVTLGGRGGSQVTRAEVALFEPADLRPPTPSAYYLRDGISYVVGSPDAPGPFGPTTQLAEIAVAPGGNLFAGVSKDRKTLWTAAGNQPQQLTVALKGTDLGSISFDQDGNVWVLDGAPDNRVLLRLAPNGVPVTAATVGFAARGTRRVRVSPDGTRMAVLLTTGEGAQLYLALITGGEGQLAVGSLRRLGFDLVDPADVGWTEPDRLAVIAHEHDSAPQPFLLSLGGVATEYGPSLADVTGLAAAPGQPLIATTATKLIFRLRPGGGWYQVAAGTFATYPG